VPEEVRGRALVVQKLEIFPRRVRGAGYLSGSGGRSTRRDAPSAASQLPAGLRESDRLPEPIFTPRTKAEIGEHDENVDFDRAAEIVGDPALMEELRRLSLEVYRRRRARRAQGHRARGHQVRVRPRARRQIVLADEVLTPDSSGSGHATVRAGRLAAVVRQAVRARLARRVRLGPLAPGPELPEECVANTRAKYVEAYERIAASVRNWLNR
jgi:phosphoribosylaminoimidazole-succinocarboxamide synthase